jgi:hypothetical protein
MSANTRPPSRPPLRTVRRHSPCPCRHPPSRPACRRPPRCRCLTVVRRLRYRRRCPCHRRCPRPCPRLCLPTDHPQMPLPLHLRQQLVCTMRTEPIPLRGTGPDTPHRPLHPAGSNTLALPSTNEGPRHHPTMEPSGTLAGQTLYAMWICRLGCGKAFPFDNGCTRWAIIALNAHMYIYLLAPAYTSAHVDKYILHS